MVYSDWDKFIIYNNTYKMLQLIVHKDYWQNMYLLKSEDLSFDAA